VLFLLCNRLGVAWQKSWLICGLVCRRVWAASGVDIQREGRRRAGVTTQGTAPPRTSASARRWDGTWARCDALAAVHELPAIWARYRKGVSSQWVEGQTTGRSDSRVAPEPAPPLWWGSEGPRARNRETGVNPKASQLLSGDLLSFQALGQLGWPLRSRGIRTEGPASRTPAPGNRGGLHRTTGTLFPSQQG